MSQQYQVILVCKCKAKMVKVRSTTSPICALCTKEIPNDQDNWHCPEENNEEHKTGYDICFACKVLWIHLLLFVSHETKKKAGGSRDKETITNRPNCGRREVRHKNKKTGKCERKKARLLYEMAHSENHHHYFSMRWVFFGMCLLKMFLFSFPTHPCK